ncbi:MAG: GNAT family N-acetyltransferase [Vulcanimicrobiaceae bacterium]
MPEIPGVVVERAFAPTEEIRALIAELDADLGGNYVPEQQHGLKLDAIFAPDMRFFVAYLDGEGVGCGGVALFDGFAEVKRMYVRPNVRGRGVADAIVARIETEARAAELRVLRLETGDAQHAAIRFYERHGFRTCGAIEPYASMEPYAIATSVFMEKDL